MGKQPAIDCNWLINVATHQCAVRFGNVRSRGVIHVQDCFMTIPEAAGNYAELKKRLRSRAKQTSTHLHLLFTCRLKMVYSNVEVGIAQVKTYKSCCNRISWQPSNGQNLCYK